MTKPTDQIDWSDFTPAQQRAIANGANGNAFPYLAALFDVMTDEMIKALAHNPERTQTMLGEFETLLGVVSEITPKVKTDQQALAAYDVHTIKPVLLTQIGCCFLLRMLNDAISKLQYSQSPIKH